MAFQAQQELALPSSPTSSLPLSHDHSSSHTAFLPHFEPTQLRTFAPAICSTWNALPQSVPVANSCISFRSLLKCQLFWVSKHPIQRASLLSIILYSALFFFTVTIIVCLLVFPLATVNISYVAAGILSFSCLILSPALRIEPRTLERTTVQPRKSLAEKSLVTFLPYSNCFLWGLPFHCLSLNSHLKHSHAEVTILDFLLSSLGIIL